MATEFVEPSAHDDLRPPSAPTIKGTMDSTDVHQKEMEIVASARPIPQRQGNSRAISDRPEEKQLGISARSLCVGDFALLRTLGTGELVRCIAHGL